MSADNNSTRKIDVGIWRKPNGAPWVYVDFLKWARNGGQAPRMIPSFRDLHRIIQAIAACEDESYPPPAKGRGHLAEFLRDAVYQHDFDTLARKYKIPERDGDVVVNTNGARLKSPNTTTPATTEQRDQRTCDRCGGVIYIVGDEWYATATGVRCGDCYYEARLHEVS